jgi:hypothetical protein
MPTVATTVNKYGIKIENENILTKWAARHLDLSVRND